MSGGGPVPRSLALATDIDVLARERVVRRRADHLVVRSPGNPGHYSGNLLIFDDPPGPGDRVRWNATFEAEFADEPRVRHRTFAWERTDGSLGSAREEFVAAGYELEQIVALIAGPHELRAHPRENGAARIRTLDPAPGADERLWQQVIELEVAGRDRRFDEDIHRQFIRTRKRELRELFLAGRGAWYVALDGGGREVLGSCGVVVTAGRGRFQSVETAEEHRRRGICSRLVVEAALISGAERLVICADPGYHALGLYESLGFRAVERVAGVMLHPPSEAPLSGAVNRSFTAGFRAQW
jgi:ribosomal protein S18 acetylase RimI-like enzyme